MEDTELNEKANMNDFYSWLDDPARTKNTPELVRNLADKLRDVYSATAKTNLVTFKVVPNGNGWRLSDFKQPQANYIAEPYISASTPPEFTLVIPAVDQGVVNVLWSRLYLLAPIGNTVPPQVLRSGTTFKFTGVDNTRESYNIMLHV